MYFNLKVILATEWSVLLTMVNQLHLHFRPLKRYRNLFVWKKTRLSRHRSNTLNVTKGKPNCAFNIKDSEHDDEKGLS